MCKACGIVVEPMFGFKSRPLEAIPMRGTIRSTASVTKRQTEDEIRELIEFWNQVRVCEELGAASWGVLEPLERAVTEALLQEPPDIVRARSLTAQAFCYISGTDVL
jgi:hypothetical protein